MTNRHVILLLAVSAFAWLPLTAPGYFLRAHDAPHALFFLQAFDESFRDGSLWPRWGTNFAFGYGYPLWNYYAPLAYMAGEGFHLLGLNITAAVKCVALLATVGSTLSMYAWARSHFSRNAAAFAAVVYTYAPYHLLDLYVRAAIAEYAALALFPLILWRWEALVQSPVPRNVVIAALATAALILTHQGAAFVFAGLLAPYMAFLLLRFAGTGSHQATRSRSPASSLWRRFVPSVVTGALSLALSAVFWIPMLLEQRYIVVEQWTSVAYNYQRHFVSSNQFLSPFWGYGYSGQGLADQMSFQLGLVPVVGAITVLASWRRDGHRRAVSVFFLAAGAVVPLLMSPYSAAFWQAVPVTALVQFPWRLLALSALSLAWLSGAALEALAGPSSDELHLPAAMLMLATALASYGYTLPQYTERSLAGESSRAAVDFELESFRDRTGYTTWSSVQPQTSPLVEDYRAGRLLAKAVALTPGAQVELLYHGGETERVRVRASTGATVQFRTYYFPGWRARIDGVPAQVFPAGPQALITLDVPAGEHVVELRLEDTAVRGIAKLISLASVILIAVWTAWIRGHPATRSRRRLAPIHPAAAAVLPVLTVTLLSACATGLSETTAEPVLPDQPSVRATAAPRATTTPTDEPTITPTPPPSITPSPVSTPTETHTPRPVQVEHVVAINETVGHIARRYGSTVDAILRANNISDPTRLRAGQRIMVPLPTATLAPFSAPDRLPTVTPGAAPPGVYTVQAGDTLSGIAVRFNLPVDDIMAANGLSDHLIRVGQTLIIPPPTPTPTVTPTSLPTSTPTPGFAYGEPWLLYPPDGAVLTGDVAPLLNWTSVGPLAADHYYVLRLRDAVDPGRSESVWLRVPSYRVGSAWRGHTIEWDVVVVQQTGIDPDGVREGRTVSPYSRTRQFEWQ